MAQCRRAIASSLARGLMAALSAATVVVEAGVLALGSMNRRPARARTWPRRRSCSRSR
jgi:hypothetical protein